MLNPEQIKKLNEVAKPEGINCYEDIDGLTLVIGIRHETLFIDNNMVLEEVFYPLFLQKCIDGVIKKYGFQFDAFYNKEKQEWDYMFFNKFNKQYPESQGLLKHINNVTTHKDIDQAKEQALIYILENIKC